MRCTGESSRSRLRSWIGWPYSPTAASAIHGSVRAKNVSKSAMPHTSMPTAKSSGWFTSAARVR